MPEPDQPLDSDALTCDAWEFAAALNQEGIPAGGPCTVDRTCGFLLAPAADENQRVDAERIHDEAPSIFLFCPDWPV